MAEGAHDRAPEAGPQCGGAGGHAVGARSAKGPERDRPGTEPRSYPLETVVKPHASPLRLAAAAALVLTLAACGSGAGRALNPFAPEGSRRNDGRVRVLIENQNFGDATVHALRGGERIRLGDVTGKSERSFTVRWNFSLPMEFEIHIVGGQGCRVRAMPVDPGDSVWVRIPTQVGMSACYSGKS